MLSQKPDLVGCPNAGLDALCAMPKNQSSVTQIPETLPDERYGCFRALKGKQIRWEIYGAKEHERNSLPCKVIESAYEVRLLQPESELTHGIFQVT